MSSSTRVRPIAPQSVNVPAFRSVPIESKTPVKISSGVKELVGALYHWATCLFIIALVFSQLVGAIWDSQVTTTYLRYGQSPTLGPFQIVGTNDVPFPDRVIACVRRGRFYEPKLVSSLLADVNVSAVVEDATGTAVHGYRLRKRKDNSVTDSLDVAAQKVYESSCRLLGKTMDNVLNACESLGYVNVTRDYLRVVDDWDSKNLYVLPDTLPILIIPFWDNSPYARHAVPTWTGDACIFRLEDAYTAIDSSSGMASFRGVNRSLHHERTIQWLNRSGGRWKNGWYEDTDGMRWYSELTSSVREAPYFTMFRLFDMRSGKEEDCSNPENCEGAGQISRWGSKFSLGNRAHKFTSVYIANATEFGLFLFESYELGFVHTALDWETAISNMSVGMVLLRWVLALVSLQMGDFHGNLAWFSGGIGCVSGSRSFAYLLFASVPGLKMTIAAFWTVGCKFEGEQRGMAEAWFVIYPAIAHVVLIYYSLLNLLAKLLRRRVSDVLFTPTVVALCLLHYFRLQIAESGWLQGIDGRVPTLITSEEISKLELVDFLSTSIAWRINGQVTLVFATKWTILAINLVPLLMARSFPITPRGELILNGVEKALAFKAWHVGGLGRSLMYMEATIDTPKRRLSSLKSMEMIVPPASNRSQTFSIGENATVAPVTPFLNQNNSRSVHNLTHTATDSENMKKEPEESKIVLVNSYELMRLGYVVFGDKYLISFDDWDRLTAVAPLRAFCHLWNHRVLVWQLEHATAGDAEIAGGRALKCEAPEMWRLDDPRLIKIPWWHISACSIQC